MKTINIWKKKGGELKILKIFLLIWNASVVVVAFATNALLLEGDENDTNRLPGGEPIPDLDVKRASSLASFWWSTSKFNSLFNDWAVFGEKKKNKKYLNYIKLKYFLKMNYHLKVYLSSFKKLIFEKIKKIECGLKKKKSF